jgi:hypothetical protein
VPRAAALAAVLLYGVGCGVELPTGWLFVTGVTRTEAVVVWTGDDLTAVRCRDPAGGVHEAAEVVARPSGLRQATIRGLAAGTPYICRVLERDGGRGRRLRFRTAPPASAPFRFAAVGDSGDGSRAAARIARRILATRPAFLVHLGDLGYPRGTPRELDAAFIGPYRRVLERVPIFPTPGNHDLTSGGAYAEVFSPLYASQAADRLHYGFEWGDARLLSVSYRIFRDPGVVERSWLGEALAAAAAHPWRIVFLHAPAYTTARKGGVQGGRWLEQILERGRADLVLAGHVHMYERADLACASDDAARVLSIVSGGGGNASLDHPRPHPNFPRAFSAPHFLRVRVRPDVVDVWAVGDRGQVLDRVRHRRGLDQPCHRRGWWWIPEPDADLPAAGAADAKGRP